jgi:general secretion pathway protein C
VALAVVEQDSLRKSGAAAMNAARAWLRRLAPFAPKRANRAPSGHVVAVVEIALVLMLAASAAPLFWAVFGPGPTIQAPQPSTSASAAPSAISNPFRVLDAPAPVADAAPANVETTLDLALHGTWVDAERPSAIIRLPDGAQKTFFVGDPVCCGAVLAGVYTTEVTISRNGVHEALRLPNRGVGSAAPLMTPAPAAAQGGITSIISFQPLQSDGLFRLRLFPASDPVLFEQLGLREGDVLVSVNNQPAPEDIVSVQALLDSLQGAKMVSLTVDRDGVRLPLDIPLDGSGGVPGGREPPQ